MHIYGDWRDKINPELLQRYWRKKGKPGIFLYHTPYSISFCIKVFGGSEVLLSPFYINDHLEELNWYDGGFYSASTVEVVKKKDVLRHLNQLIVS